MTAAGTVREIVRRRVPARWRRAARRVLREAPARARDFLPDLLDRFRADPLPPARLRDRVAGTSSRRVFLASGREASENVREVFEASRRPDAAYGRWLDFGCGCGRVARHLARLPWVEDLTGVDVDTEAVHWLAAHQRGRFAPMASDPPIDLAPATIDVAYAGSVFTHLDEAPQFAWLAELHRVMRPGGLLIASTHSPTLVWSRPDLPEAARESLARRGFAFAPGGGAFNDDSAFHSREYLLETWGRSFGLRHFRQYGLNRYQDLCVWEKW